MIAGISILCFAASYAVALVLEASRLFFRSGVRRAILLAFGGAGFVAHTLFLAYRAQQAATAPLSSPQEWYLVAAWLLAAVYLYLTLHYPRTASGLFTLPLVLGLVGVARFFADQAPFPETKASQFWGMIHGAFLLLGTVAVLVGFVAGLMHLVQAYRLKHKLPRTQRFQLPSLELLEKVSGQAIVISVLMLGIGFLSGTILNWVNHAKQIDELPWTDPVVWSSSLLAAWLVAAALFSGLYKPARQGRKVAYLTVGSFLFLVFSLGIRLLVPSEHGNPTPKRPIPGAESRAPRPGPGGPRSGGGAA